MTAVSFTHVVNTLVPPTTSDLVVAQPLTLESMRQARDAWTGPGEITLVAASYREDAQTIPDDFQTLTPLTRSSLDIANLDDGRRLPHLADILERAFRETSSDYLIYTNVDILVCPDFYNALRNTALNGYDAFVINKRIVSDQYASVNDLPAIFADAGKPHPGWDCFVFHRDLFEKFRLRDVIIGAPGIGLALLANCMTFADRFELFEDLQLTWHIGEDSFWKAEERQRPVNVYNRRLTLNILKSLMQDVTAPHWRQYLSRQIRNQSANAR